MKKKFFRRFKKVRIERMTIDELKEEYECKINVLKKELDDKIAKLQSANKRWKPEDNEKYYYINAIGEVNCLIFTNDNIDNQYYNFHNIYKTEEEAKFAIEQFKIIAQLKQYADDDQEWNDNNNWHWCIEYDTITECIRINNYHYLMSGVPFNLYFSSEEQAIKAINAIGEDKLKKYYFCI